MDVMDEDDEDDEDDVDDVDPGTQAPKSQKSKYAREAERILANDYDVRAFLDEHLRAGSHVGILTDAGVGFTGVLASLTEKVAILHMLEYPAGLSGEPEIMSVHCIPYVHISAVSVGLKRPKENSNGQRAKRANRASRANQDSENQGASDEGVPDRAGE